MIEVTTKMTCDHCGCLEMLSPALADWSKATLTLRQHFHGQQRNNIEVDCDLCSTCSRYLDFVTKPLIERLSIQVNEAAQQYREYEVGREAAKVKYRDDLAPRLIELEPFMKP